MAITAQPQRAGFPLALALPPDCLPRDSWVKISQVRTISVDRIGKRLGEVDPEDLAQIVGGLLELIS
jgi:mRNA interferase MazF